MTIRGDIEAMVDDRCEAKEFFTWLTSADVIAQLQKDGHDIRSIEVYFLCVETLERKCVGI